MQSSGSFDGILIGLDATQVADALITAERASAGTGIPRMLLAARA